MTTDSAGNVIPITTNGNTTDGWNVGGRILRISPRRRHDLRPGLQYLRQSGCQQLREQQPEHLLLGRRDHPLRLRRRRHLAVKTTASLASSSTGSYVGLNDLRSLGVPYEGQDTAVAIVDTGVDALVPSFRGRVSPGFNVITNGLGNSDTSPGPRPRRARPPDHDHRHHDPGTTLGATATTPLNSDGHGTTVAGVVAQFVPQRPSSR